MPPAFSAKHVGGRRLYELARRGEAVVRSAAPVTVHAIEPPGAPRRAKLEVAVRCSPGTYVRALARDLGERLGTGGAPHRAAPDALGSFDLRRRCSGDDLAAAADAAPPARRALLLDLPAVRVGDAGRRARRPRPRAGEGRRLEGFPEAPVDRVRVLDEAGDLLALAVPRGLLPAEPGGPPRFPALHPDVVLVGSTDS